MNYNHVGNVSFKWPFKNFPLTDWISLTTRYTGNFDWTRAPLLLTMIRFSWKHYSKFKSFSMVR
jgi:hypothetical protein